MLLNIYAVFMIILLFSVTVFVHEFGHFLLARKLGLCAEVFSIGFGPSLWQKKVNGVIYKVGILPFGGYVSLPQLDPNGEGTTRDGEPLPNVVPWKKIVVAAAGATFNMIFAFVLAVIVFYGAKTVGPEKTNVIGYVYPESAAAENGFLLGDEIIAVNGQTVASWEDFILGAAFEGQTNVTVDVKRASGGTFSILADTEEMMGARVVTGIEPVSFCRVLLTRKGSSAEKAGIVEGDRVFSIDGVELKSRRHMQQLVNAATGKEITLVVNRGDEVLTLNMIPDFFPKGTVLEGATQPLEKDLSLIGVEFNFLEARPPIEQIKGHASMIFKMLGKLLNPQTAGAAQEGLGGAPAIFQMLFYSVKTSLLLALSLTCMLNVNLAIVNMLPIPVLDGGHIMFSTIELVTRRPVPPKVVVGLSNVFAVLLILAMLFISGRDVYRMAPKAEEQAATEVVETTNAVPATAEQ